MNIENNEILLSLCIPTNGMLRYVKNVIDSIYMQGVDTNLFEVVITDNGERSDLAQYVKNLEYKNLRYYKTSDLGFLNQLACLKYSKGIYSKMLNHRSCLRPGALHEILKLVIQNAEKKPIMYFIDGNISGYELQFCNDANEFVALLHYWITWSAGVGVWDIDKQKLQEVEFNPMFPHLAILFQLRKFSKYLVWNKRFQIMQDDKGKGGYDLFHTFSVIFIDYIIMLNRNNVITEKTYRYVKKKMYKHLGEMYFRHVVLKLDYTFDIKNVRESITTHYSVLQYYKIVLKYRFLKKMLYDLKNVVKKVINK